MSNRLQLDCLSNRLFLSTSKISPNIRETSPLWWETTGHPPVIHRRPVDSLHKGSVMWKIFPCHDFIMIYKHTHIRTHIWSSATLNESLYDSNAGSLHDMKYIPYPPGSKILTLVTLPTVQHRTWILQPYAPRKILKWFDEWSTRFSDIWFMNFEPISHTVTTSHDWFLTGTYSISIDVYRSVGTLQTGD